jgi:hypothetical protein
MADAEDLKSSGPKGRAGSTPALGTKQSESRELPFCSLLFLTGFPASLHAH